MQLTVIDATRDDVFGDIARLDLKHRPNSKAGKIILLDVAGQKTYAVARGLRSGSSADQIALDSALRERLGIKTNQTYEFSVLQVGFWGELCWAWHSTDALPRIAARLSALSVLLGLIGLVLGIMSLCR